MLSAGGASGASGAGGGACSHPVVTHAARPRMEKKRSVCRRMVSERGARHGRSSPPFRDSHVWGAPRRVNRRGFASLTAHGVLRRACARSAVFSSPFLGFHVPRVFVHAHVE